jgi:hypothetical protein
VTPSEWIAVLALLVALVGPLAAVLVARNRNAHEARLAHDARTQARREALYVDLVDYSHTIGDLVERRRPFIGYASDPPPPELPDDAARRRLRARAGVIASPAVRSRLDAIGEASRAFHLVAAEMDDEDRTGREDPSRPGRVLRQDLDAKRQAVRDAITALENECAAELGPGPA